jgi:LysM repeat protein
MNVSIMAVDSGGSPVGVDRMLPFTMHEELKNVSENMRCEPEVKVISAGYSMAGSDRIDIRIECAVEASVYSVHKENAIVDMSLDEANPKAAGNEKTLTLYYADSGERIWDIAKRYNTSMEAVKRENNLEADSLQDRSMLLIPKKRCART